MSETYNTPSGVRFGTFTGPAAEGEDRKRWQLETDGLVVFRRAEAFELASALLASLARDGRQSHWRHELEAGSPPEDDGGPLDKERATP